METKVYGIDLGTTYSAIATLDERGMPEIIENFVDSSPLLASAVYFPESGDPVVGKEAKNQTEMEPELVVQFIKREIGKADAIKRTFEGVAYDPIDISALILKRMKEYAEEQGYEVRDVVITCPAYFGNEERNATKQAGTIAGLNVLNIVNEPTAAALNYCSKAFQEENRRILVYDLGGGTLDTTLLNFSVDEEGKSEIQVLATAGNDRLGGIDWDNRLNDYISDFYAQENGISREQMEDTLRQTIRNQVEDVKRALSNMTVKSFTVNYAGESTRVEITRETFEEITKDLVSQTMDFVHSVLQEAKLSPEDIDTVLLVGGSTRMPMIQAAIKAEFPGKVQVQDPDLAVAKGAALAAAIAWSEKAPVKSQAPERPESPSGFIGNLHTTFHDILSRSFGPGIFITERDGRRAYVIENLIFRDDPSPSKNSKIYGTMEENQSGVVIPIFENMSMDKENPYVTPSVDQYDKEQYTNPALKVKALGKVMFNLPAGTPKGSPIEVIFDLSTSGLVVTAVNQITGERFSETILSYNTKTPEELEEATLRLEAITTTGQI